MNEDNTRGQMAKHPRLAGHRPLHRPGSRTEEPSGHCSLGIRTTLPDVVSFWKGKKLSCVCYEGSACEGLSTGWTQPDTFSWLSALFYLCPDVTSGENCLGSNPHRKRRPRHSLGLCILTCKIVLTVVRAPHWVITKVMEVNIYTAYSYVLHTLII